MTNFVKRLWLAATVIACLSLPARAELTETLIPVTDRPAAPAFTLPDTDGNEVSLIDLRGKVIVLSFWATWCPPCREEMPSMQSMWQRLRGDDFELLAVNVGEDEDQVFAFRYEFEQALEFPIVLDEHSKVVSEYPVRGLPTTFVIDKHGRIAYRAVGGHDWSADSIIDTVGSLMRSPRTAQPGASGWIDISRNSVSN